MALLIAFLIASSLFYWQGLKHAIINIDDSCGKLLVNELRANELTSQLGIITYGINSGDLLANNIKITLDGMQFKLHHQNETVDAKVKIIGKFNVYNLLAVAACLLISGYTLPQIIEILAKLTPVCGRMDTIKLPGKPLVVIDYAHTPDALENTLKTLRDVEHSGRLYCVFGCGGNRDTTKRPKMGKIASRIADYVYITSDNPRNEDPSGIIRQIVAGVGKNNYETITHRDEAIKNYLVGAVM